MVELLTNPPPMAAIARMNAIDGVRIAPKIVAIQEGPDRHLGPESAAALLLLQTTFADEARAAEFWDRATDLFELLATAPGFIRRFSFADGPLFTLVALWRTRDHADAFFASDAHQAAMRDLFRGRWQYSHFAGLWEMTSPRPRMIFCQACDGITPIADRHCVGCGIELFDPYVGTSHVDG